MDKNNCDRDLFFHQFYPFGFGLKTRFPGDADSSVDGNPPAAAANVFATRKAVALRTGSGEGGTRFAQQKILAAV